MASPNTLRRKEEIEHLRSFSMNVVSTTHNISREEKRRQAKNFAKIMKCGFREAVEAMKRYELQQKIDRQKALQEKLAGNVLKADDEGKDEPSTPQGVGFKMGPVEGVSTQT